MDFTKAMHAAMMRKPDSEDCFEKTFSQKPVFTSSGRGSLYAILKSLNLSHGAFVGVPLFCCSIVFDVIRQAGLNPVFIDNDLDDYNLSVSDLKRKKSSLSALIVVHMFGHPADMDEILSVCDDIPVIEDCAHSLFSKYKGKFTGTLSMAAFFSFRSGKYISAGEGSAIFCTDTSLRAAISEQVTTFEKRKLNHEIYHCTTTYIKSMLYKRPWYGFVGYPVGRRLDLKLNLTAKNGFEKKQIAKSDLTIIKSRFNSFINKINKQRQNAQFILENLKLKTVCLPHQKDGCVSNYYQFAVRFKRCDQRNRMASFLFTNGIDSAKYLDEIDEIARTTYDYKGDCPNAELSSKTVLVVPHYYSLSDQDLEHVVTSLNKGSNL